ncbi:MAG: cupin domain-containing protein [Gaiellales bacterium]
MSGRVTHRTTTASAAADGVERAQLVPPEAGSELALEGLVLGAGTSVELGDDREDVLVLVSAGSGVLRVGETTSQVAAVSSLHIPAGAAGGLRAGDSGLECVRVSVGPAVDLHAPIGPPEPAVELALVEAGTATGSRSFQILHGPHNGSVRATAFGGTIPPGKAPWHYHLYDEIVWVREGAGRLHLDDETEDLVPGSVFRLHPREVHIVENLSPDATLEVVGFFTPAGSPSAAYLEPHVAASYAIDRA